MTACGPEKPTAMNGMGDHELKELIKVGDANTTKSSAPADKTTAPALTSVAGLPYSCAIDAAANGETCFTCGFAVTRAKRCMAAVDDKDLKTTCRYDDKRVECKKDGKFEPFVNLIDPVENQIQRNLTSLDQSIISFTADNWPTGLNASKREAFLDASKYLRTAFQDFLLDLNPARFKFRLKKSAQLQYIKMNTPYNQPEVALPDDFFTTRGPQIDEVVDQTVLQLKVNKYEKSMNDLLANNLSEAFPAFKYVSGFLVTYGIDYTIVDLINLKLQ